MKAALIALVVLLALAAGGYWYMEGSGSTAQNFGPAAASDGATNVTFEWFLSEGELALGNEEIRVPRGINVLLSIDSDSADSISVPGLGVQSALAADAVTPLHFFAYKLGHYEITLASNGQVLGTLEIYEGDT